MKHFLLVDLYAPETIAECVLPSNIKNTFQGFIDTDNIPNLLLSGNPGMGKTTTIRCLAKQLQRDFVIINGSKEKGIDNVRNTIYQYGSSYSTNGKKKILLIDEADGLTVDAQDALRGVIEELQSNCVFVFTCNYKNKIIEAIRNSRTTNIDFVIPKSEKVKLCEELLARLKNIMEQEKIEYDPLSLAQLIKSYFPDIRRILNEIQKFSSNTEKKLIVKIVNSDYTKLFSILKTKNFNNIRKWVEDNKDYQDFPTLISDIWENVDKYIEAKSIPSFIMICSDYQDKFARAINSTIHLMAFLIEISSELTFK